MWSYTVSLGSNVCVRANAVPSTIGRFRSVGVWLYCTFVCIGLLSFLVGAGVSPRSLFSCFLPACMRSVCLLY